MPVNFGLLAGRPGVPQGASVKEDDLESVCLDGFANFRDGLLPRLISGEQRLPEACELAGTKA